MFTEPQERKMNLVLIVADTFRRDRLGCYGNRRIHTPHLDRMSRSAITFDRCYASSFPTMPARADMFTGKYTFTFMGWEPLPQEEPTLAQLLSEAGYHTFGVADTPFFVRNGYGYDRGFEDFHWVRGQRIGPERDAVTHAWRYEEDRFAAVTMRVAERWLERNHKHRFFLYVDTWDPHEPWDPPSYYVRLYSPRAAEQKCPYPCYWEWEQAGLTEEQIEVGDSYYCAEITMVDRWIGRLLERLESLALMEKTVIVFTSDHGFYVGEHGLYGKARLRSENGGFYVGGGRAGPDDKVLRVFREPDTDREAPGELQWYRSPLYDEVARVPLIVHVPNARAGRSNALVTLPDLMPTMLELAGSQIPETVQSPSLVPLLEGKRSNLHDVVVTTLPLYVPGERIRIVDDLERRVQEPSPSTITDGEWTLIYSVAGEPIELYHTASDPTQENNVFDDNKEVCEQLHGRFVRLLKGLDSDEAIVALRRTL